MSQIVVKFTLDIKFNFKGSQPIVFSVTVEWHNFLSLQNPFTHPAIKHKTNMTLFVDIIIDALMAGFCFSYLFFANNQCSC